MQTIKDTNTHPMTCLGEITTRPSISSCLRRLDSKINVTPLVTRQLSWKSVDLMFDQANMRSCWVFIFKNSSHLHHESLMMTARFTSTNTIFLLYITMQNNTDMKRARELVLALSNPDFKISLSCCYSCTQNYKKSTMQAKRRHDGKGISAKISLHNAPRVGV